MAESVTPNRAYAFPATSRLFVRRGEKDDRYEDLGKEGDRGEEDDRGEDLGKGEDRGATAFIILTSSVRFFFGSTLSTRRFFLLALSGAVLPSPPFVPFRLLPLFVERSFAHALLALDAIVLS